MRSLRSTLLAVLLLPAFLPLLPPPASAADEAFTALQKEFAGQVAGRAEGASRVSLVKRLSTYDTPEGARLLVEGVESLGTRYDADLVLSEKTRKEYEKVNVPVDVMKDNYKTRTDLQNRLMEQDALRREDNRVLDALRDAFKVYKVADALSALTKSIHGIKSGRARETAAEGLAGNAAGVDSAVKLAKDCKEPLVNAAVLRGFKGRKEDGVFTFAMDCLKAESWPERLEAVGVLEGVNQPRVLKPLIDAMAKEEGRLREDVRDALRRLTSQNYDADPALWMQWYVDNRANLEGAPPDTALFGSFKGKGSGPAQKSVYGIESRSRKIVFIIDTSGSMKEPITKAKGTPTGLTGDQLEDLNSTKIEIAKKELTRAVRSLEPEASFNIISFGTNVTVWHPKMVKGDMKTKNEAFAFINDLQPAGGTWSYGALQEAFQFAGMGVLDKYYDPAADTFYFISDGAPTDNDMDTPALIEPQTILDAVKDWNRLGKVVIHAVAIDPRTGGGRFIQFMRRLAADNGGMYTQRD